VNGRPGRGFFGGLLLGFLLDIDFVLAGTVKVESVVLTIIPLVLMAVGLALGLWAPLGRRRTPGPAPTITRRPPPI
jgi:hypothetical protein